MSSNPARLTTYGRTVTNAAAEVIREKVQDGVTGEQREIQYTQCKIVGNGSFGVVFQTKLSPSGEDAAIKRVLQDKRFKVCPDAPYLVLGPTEEQPRSLCSRTVSFKSCESCATQILCNSRHSITLMENA